MPHSNSKMPHMNFLLGGGLGKLKFSEKIKVSPPLIRLACRRGHTLPPQFLGHSSAFMAL